MGWLLRRDEESDGWLPGDCDLWTRHGAGINADGQLFIGLLEVSAPKVDFGGEIQLQLEAQPSAAEYTVSLRATTIATGKVVEITREVAQW
jgi:hypothetical protein